MYDYDIIVIGAGSGGLVAALTANRRGAKVAMLEKRKIGGECTHSGCIPSKALINSVKTLTAIRHAEQVGLPAIDVEPEFGRIMAHVESVVDGIYEHEKPEIFTNAGIKTVVHPSGARFVDEHTVTIGDETLTAKNFIVCTGSSPRIIPVEGIDSAELITNENFWELRDLPNSIVFIGGGVISVEIGQSLARLGSDVTILDLMPRIISMVDEDIASYLYGVLAADGIKTITGSLAKSGRKLENGQYELTIDHRNGEFSTIITDAVFMGVGRAANVNGIDLENAGVEYSPRGIVINEHLQTSTPHIYAVGDVATPAKFTHVAAYQAEIAVKNILYGNERVNDLSVLPWAIFTDPEVGHVGLTEAQAREKMEGVQANTVTASIDRYITDNKVGGLIKVVMDANDVIVGGTAVGAHAGEWVQLLTLAIRANMTAQDVADTIFAYPSYSEIVKKAFTRFLRTKL